MDIVTGSEVLIKDGIKRTAKQVAIVGFAPSSCFDVKTLFGNPDVEIWALNQLYVPFPEIVPYNRPKEQRNPTRWFQIHHKHSYNANVNRDITHHEWLQQVRQFPIYMQNRESDVPCSIEFPKDLLLDKFRRYFTNSISWMLALAIYEGFEKVHLFGVDMAQDSEYAFERPSVEYFLGYVEGAGIKLALPEKSDLLKSMWLYPYEDESIMRTKMESRKTELKNRMNNVSNQEQLMRDQRMTLIGALENMNYVDRCWINSGKEIDEMRPMEEYQKYRNKTE